jgi:hypothetical protein
MTDDELMRRAKLRRHAAAANASLLLVQDALVQIRAMAYLRKEVAAREAESPLDYHERIRLIADVCENLPGHLRANTPVQGLRYAWHNANDVQQAWMRETLAQRGITITELVAN